MCNEFSTYLLDSSLATNPFSTYQIFSSGEIGRHAVHCSIARQFDDVIADYHVVDQILGQLAKVTIRNKSGANDDLRRKFDQIKWTLKKVEQLVYDISFQRTPGVSETDSGSIQ